MTFEAFVELYKTNIKERLKQSTWQTKISIIDNKILPYFCKKRMTDIKVSDVVAWQNKLLNMADENGDMLITLSTCEYTYTNGRFVVVAKKIVE